MNYEARAQIAAEEGCDRQGAPELIPDNASCSSHWHHHGKRSTRRFSIIDSGLMVITNSINVANRMRVILRLRS